MISLNGCPITQGKYSDNSLHMRIPNYVKRDAVAITWNYENDGELFALACVRKHLGKSISLFLPYCPYAKLDTLSSHEDVYALKYFCEAINDLKFTNVIVHDPYSQACVTLLDNGVGITPIYYIDLTIKEINSDKLLVFYPDENALNKYSTLVQRPFGFALKDMDWKKEVVKKIDLYGEDVKDRDILIIDNYCSAGNTFAPLIKRLKEAGANKIYIYVTHCEKNMIDSDLIKMKDLEKIYTTNSIYPTKLPCEKISIIRTV